jgi:hypothetical protein
LIIWRFGQFVHASSTPFFHAFGMVERDPNKAAADSWANECISADEPPRAKRDSILLLANIVRTDGEDLGQAKVRNLSATGMMAEFQGVVAGEELVVVFRSGAQIFGKVVWVRNGQIGVSFAKPIDPQIARKSVHVGPVDNMPPYLRALSRSKRFQ